MVFTLRILLLTWRTETELRGSSPPLQKTRLFHVRHTLTEVIFRGRGTGVSAAMAGGSSWSSAAGGGHSSPCWTNDWLSVAAVLDPCVPGAAGAGLGLLPGATLDGRSLRRGFGGSWDGWGFSANWILWKDSTGLWEGLGEASMNGGDFWSGWDEEDL